MLSVRFNPRSATCGVQVEDLVAQVRGRRLRSEVARQLIGASLDLLLATLPRRGTRELHLKALVNGMWQIERHFFVYIASNDDDALRSCINVAFASDVTVVVPSGDYELKSQLLRAALKDRSPHIFTFSAFISWRILSASLDQKWTQQRAMNELFAAYNRRVLAAGSHYLVIQGIHDDS